MKEKLVYGIIFSGAFVIVTAAIIFLNSTFNNIFEFDFSPPQTPKVIVANTNQQNEDQQKQNSEDGIKDETTEPAKPVSGNTTQDTTVVNYKMDKSILDSLNILRNKIATLEKQQTIKNSETKANEIKTLSKKEDSLKTVAASESKKIDTKKFELWAKETAKLYESMDPKKAAKIIQSYSDNESREVIFKMNKKKAAKILSELDPEIALRITKAL